MSLHSLLKAKESLSPQHWTHQRGLENESLIVKKYMEEHQAFIIGRRIKTPFAEIDILALLPKNRLVLIEVKSVSNWDFIQSRLTKNQKNRLLKAAEFLQSNTLGQVEIHLVFVDPFKNILILDQGL